MTAGMVRRGDQLLRPMGSWLPAVHEYLRHLEAAGFGGAPRLLEIEVDREILTFIDGNVANDPEWQPGRGHRLPPYARTEPALANRNFSKLLLVRFAVFVDRVMGTLERPECTGCPLPMTIGHF